MTWTILQTLVLPSQGGSTKNLALIGRGVSEKKIFENGGQTTVDEGCLRINGTHNLCFVAKRWVKRGSTLHGHVIMM